MSRPELVRYLPFAEALIDKTSGQRKIFRRDYLKDGMLPVVDQGSDLIAGYTDDYSSAYNGPLPVIVFGDHTRAFKYVDFPFAIGADGAKVLEPTPAFEPRYLYYYLLTQQITSRGYSRHFQFLRDFKIRWVPGTEQRRIVEVLDQADHLRRLRAESDTRADRILPALFLKMFGDPSTNPMGWPHAPLACLLSPVDKRDPREEPDKSFTYIDIAGVDGTSGEIVGTKILFGSQAPSRARQIVLEGDVLVSTVRPYLRATAQVPRNLDGQICSTGFSVLRAKKRIGRGYLYALSRTHWFTEQLMARARGASYPAVTNRDILGMRVPLPNDQVELGRCNYAVGAILENQRERKIARNRIDALFNSLLQLVFSASLTEPGNEARTAQLQREFKRQTKWSESSLLSQRKRGGTFEK